MTYRDPAPMHPDCPVCETAEHVVRHNNEYQGRWLCSGCMLLFDGTTAEWVRPEREREDISDGLEAARAALREAAER
jgi:ribosomal protein L37AE/L43A